jgi:hypothetical protein
MFLSVLKYDKANDHKCFKKTDTKILIVLFGHYHTMSGNKWHHNLTDTKAVY